MRIPPEISLGEETWWGVHRGGVLALKQDTAPVLLPLGEVATVGQLGFWERWVKAADEAAADASL